MQKFRVLVVDDDETVIKKIGGGITPKHTIAGETWGVNLVSVHIKTVIEDGRARFTDETLEQLAKSCVPAPHLILADYGFATAEQRAALKERRITPQQYVNEMLTVADLPDHAEKYVCDKRSDGIPHLNEVREGLRGNPCKIYLYTFTPQQDAEAFPTVAERTKLTQESFLGTVVPVDTLNEFYENGRFASKHDSAFYAYLVTIFMENTIRRELLEFVLKHEEQRLRYVRYRRSAVGVLTIVLVGGSVGAVGEWIGHWIVSLLTSGLWPAAVTLLVLALFVFFFVGLVLPIFFEKLMSNLLSHIKDEDAKLAH